MFESCSFISRAKKRSSVMDSIDLMRSAARMRGSSSSKRRMAKGKDPFGGFLVDLEGVPDMDSPLHSIIK